VDPNLRRGTLAGLLAFLEQCATDPELNTVTVRAMKSSVGTVARLLDLDLGQRVAEVDVEALMDRFQAAKGTSFRSAATYRTRMRVATQLYQAWLDNDPEWRAVARTKSSHRPPQGLPTVRVVQFPASHDLTLTLELPASLNRQTADRLIAMINSFVLDDERGA
jgi:hypothetical protein